jgi:hypothetical protein
VTYLGPENTSDFSGELSTPESLDTWQVLLTRTTMLAMFGTEQAYLAAVAGNVLWYVKRHTAEGWIRARSYGTAALDEANSYQLTLKALGFGEPN